MTVYLQHAGTCNMQVVIHKDDARMPVKAGPQEVGYDLVCVSKVKDMQGCTMYDTGISIKPPEGYYAEIVARSSIVKYNTMLANGVGIIDPTYRGTLKVCLTNPVAVPFSLCQLILKPIPPDIPLTKVQSLDTTYRNGGFGSTGHL